MTRRQRKTYVAAADFLRVFAVGLVACFHIWQQAWFDPNIRIGPLLIDLQGVIRRGYMGVDLMLLLSGFLLYLPVARSGEMPRSLEFYSKRLRRILPSYLFAVGVCALLTLRDGPVYGAPPLWFDLATHLTFTYTFFRGTYLWSSLNVALWTLAIEMQFYLLFPLVGRAFLKKPWLTFAAMTAAALGFRAAISPLADVSVLFNQLPAMLDLYACGMLAAHLLAPRRRNGGWPYALGAALCLALVLQMMWAQSPMDSRDLNRLQMVWRLPLGALGGAFLWCGGQWGRRWERAAGNSLTKWCAAISYNFYIWHQYLAVKLKAWQIPPYLLEPPQQYEGRSWQALYMLLCFLFAFAAAAAGTYLIEKPAGRLWDRLSRKDHAPARGEHHAQ